MTPPPEGRLRISLLALTALCALNAFAGGIGLVANGLGVPEAELEDTPFSSFVIPGILLAAVVGGTMALACALVWRRHRLASWATVFAGATMLVWIAIEAVMIEDGRPLQVTVAVLALATIALGWRALDAGRHVIGLPRHAAG
jgi:hypothetical protein